MAAGGYMRRALKNGKDFDRQVNMSGKGNRKGSWGESVEQDST
jgi:hypothetical protein